MVQLMSSDFGGLGPERRRKCPVKVEVDDSVDGGPAEKRAKQWSSECSGVQPAQPPAQYSPLDEPSPLGLRLRKSSSLLDLIQMRLSQGLSEVSAGEEDSDLDLAKKKDGKGGVTAATGDKLKASNFPVSLLRIGSWECVSRHEGDLVAKCYYAKHKLVWEVLDGPLKSKIEIQWSDITDIKATCPVDKLGTLDIVLVRQPLFFRETNPQPRKHTLWQATSDFTGGQASKHRRHYLQCAPGILNKHFEKLIQCDPRLNLLSRQSEIKLECPFFETRDTLFEDSEDSKCHSFDPIKKEVPTFSGFHDSASPVSTRPTSTIAEVQDTAVSREVGVAPCLVLDSRNADAKKVAHSEDVKDNIINSSRWDNIKVPGLRPSISMSDLMNHIGQCISEQMTTGNPFFAPEGEGRCSKDMLEEINQYLLSDAQLPASDEQSLMSRVESLCCLLQKDAATVQNLQIMNEDGTFRHPDLVYNSSEEENRIGGEPSTAGGGSRYKQQQPQALTRKDSIGDLLANLPRIASLPQFLYNIPEDHDNQAR